MENAAITSAKMTGPDSVGGLSFDIEVKINR
jgi:hypothetical protein